MATELIKNGMLTENSFSDYAVKKAEYYDEEGYNVADEHNKGKLKKPKKISDLNKD